MLVLVGLDTSCYARDLSKVLLIQQAANYFLQPGLSAKLCGRLETTNLQLLIQIIQPRSRNRRVRA